MSTFRIAKRERFTTVNRSLVNDQRLSFRARGILVWLLDKPDDWAFTSESITKESPEGRDAVRSALRELADAGYLRRDRVQNDKGKWITETVLYESPGQAEDGIPGVGNPAVGETAVGEPGPIQKTEPKTETEGKTSSSPSLAQTLAQEWWESKDPRPSQPFMAAKKVIESLLKSHPEDRVRAAVMEMPVISGAAFDLWRTRNPLPVKMTRRPSADAFHYAVANFFQYEADRMRWLQEHLHENQGWMDSQARAGELADEIASQLIKNYEDSRKASA